MKNLNFVDPDAVSKRIILTQLQRLINEHNNYNRHRSNSTNEAVLTPDEVMEWFDSLTNEVVLTPDEVEVVYNLLERYIFIEWYDPISGDYYSFFYKLALLFNSIFFSDVQDDSDFLLFKRLFRTELFNDERIKSIPLLFVKADDKETFVPFVEKIINEIRVHCAQNKEFAEAYQAKLAEIRNNNGSLPERLAFYVDSGITNALIHELEQPALEMFREYPNSDTISEYSIIDLLFVSLLQTPDGIQIPRWNEENYLCRLLLDYAITSYAGILDKLFRDYTTTDVFLIICNHLKWCDDNMPQYPRFRRYDPREDFIALEKHRKEYAEFLRVQLPELSSGDIPQEYSDLLHAHFFSENGQYPYKISYSDSLFNHFYFDSKPSRVKQRLDLVQSYAHNSLGNYLTKKIALAIIENDHEQILEISRLFDDNENKDWIKKLDWEQRWYGIREEIMPSKGEKRSLPEDLLEGLQSRISSAMKFFESGDHADKLRDILKASKNDVSFLKPLLFFLLKNKKDTSSTPLSLEHFVHKYIPLEIVPHILDSSAFQEENEDVYQSMIQQYPGLSREDALLKRLSPCFAAIAIKKTNGMLVMLNWASTQCDSNDPNAPRYDSKVQLFLCILDTLCERQEKKHESVALICEIIFRKWMYCIPAIHDIIKKYPQVRKLIIEDCYKILESWNMPICTPISSCQIQANIPACIIGLHKGAWYGLKPLLIALRKTRMEWVNASLGVNNDCHPNGNSNLVKEIKLYFDFFQESLKSLRQDMANGLSDWLKPLPKSKRGDLEKRLTEFPEIEQDREGFDITYTEPDPVWRYAYVRAIADLGVDVDGKGHYIHSVMDMAAKEDPSEMVRKAAEKASAKLKNLRNGWDGDEHYQKITLAFWWIKQASRLALNLPINREGSLETRIGEGEENSTGRKVKLHRWGFRKGVA